MKRRKILIAIAIAVPIVIFASCQLQRQRVNLDIDGYNDIVKTTSAKNINLEEGDVVYESYVPEESVISQPTTSSEDYKIDESTQKYLDSLNSTRDLSMDKISEDNIKKDKEINKAKAELEKQATQNAQAQTNNNSFTNILGKPAYADANQTLDENATRTALLNNYKKYLGIPYRLGGESYSGIDCSAFVQKVYADTGIRISRTTYTQVHEGVPTDRLKPGDLIFFDTILNSDSPYDHVGMYIGNDKMVHASERLGVAEVSLLDYYYNNRITGKRSLV